MHRIVRRLAFSYGHRLLDYDGKCAHPHGHNATVEVELSGDDLDARGMVCDFGEVKRRLSDFIERELDHRMILRRDDPLIAALESVGECPFVMEANPTAENLAKLIFDTCRTLGLPVTAVRLWETENCFAEYRESAPKPSRGRSLARVSFPDLTSPRS
jgi:6-pyruvoyltetrahydropterin/6-carboxytetrahydropterin synthase